ncbi:MAG TPA: hypothetical protein PKA39_14660 [Ignavibacteria bacterium]|nr:hypothetical protein [Ignavibacteria bacterium]
MKNILLKFTVFLILFILGLQTNFELSYYLLFYLNREALTEAVCEKKTETCKACCYLNKQIEKETEENSPMIPEKEKKSTEIKIQEYFPANFGYKNTSYKKLKNIITDQLFLTSNFKGSIFHPPKAEPFV